MRPYSVLSSPVVLEYFVLPLLLESYVKSQKDVQGNRGTPYFSTRSTVYFVGTRNILLYSSSSEYSKYWYKKFRYIHIFCPCKGNVTFHARESGDSINKNTNLLGSQCARNKNKKQRILQLGYSEAHKKKA